MPLDTETAGLALYVLALGLALSFFVPYALSYAGVPLQIIFTALPLAVALVIYLLASRLLSGRGRVSTYLPLALAAIPIFVFPNLRVHSTVWDRVAPTLVKVILGASCAAFSASLVFASRRAGTRGALALAAFSLLLATAVSCPLFAPDLSSLGGASSVLLLSSLILGVSAGMVS